MGRRRMGDSGRGEDEGMVKKCGGMRRKYRRRSWFHRLVLAILDPEVKPTTTARCEAAGIDPATYYRALQDFDFVADLEREVTRVSGLEAAEIRAALKRAAFAGDMRAIELWLSHFERRVRLPRSSDELGEAVDADAAAALAERLVLESERLIEAAGRLMDRLENGEG